MLDPFVGLVGSGFSPGSAARLVALKRRQEHGDFRELTDEEKRFLFGRWLITHGRVSEGVPALPTESLTDFFRRFGSSVSPVVSAETQPSGELALSRRGISNREYVLPSPQCPAASAAPLSLWPGIAAINTVPAKAFQSAARAEGSVIPILFSKHEVPVPSRRQRARLQRLSARCSAGRQGTVEHTGHQPLEEHWGDGREL